MFRISIACSLYDEYCLEYLQHAPGMMIIVRISVACSLYDEYCLEYLQHAPGMMNIV